MQIVKASVMRAYNAVGENIVIINQWGKMCIPLLLASGSWTMLTVTTVKLVTKRYMVLHCKPPWNCLGH